MGKIFRQFHQILLEELFQCQLAQYEWPTLTVLEVATPVMLAYLHAHEGDEVENSIAVLVVKIHKIR